MITTKARRARKQRSQSFVRWWCEGAARASHDERGWTVRRSQLLPALAAMTMAIETKEDIARVLRRNGDQIRALGARRLGLFGSFVRGEQRLESDVDLLVEFESGKKTFDNFMALSFLLEDLLRRRIELVTAESLSPYLRSHIPLGGNLAVTS